MDSDMADQIKDGIKVYFLLERNEKRQVQVRAMRVEKKGNDPTKWFVFEVVNFILISVFFSNFSVKCFNRYHPHCTYLSFSFLGHWWLSGQPKSAISPQCYQEKSCTNAVAVRSGVQPYRNAICFEQRAIKILFNLK